MEKLVNNFRSNTFNILAVLLLTSGLLYSQDVYRKGGTYTIDTITVVGLKNFSDRTVVTYSGLRQGQSIQVPGEEISAILKKLWNLELFSNVDLYVTDINNGAIKLEINVEEFITIKGFKALGNQITAKKIKNITLKDVLPFEEETKVLEEIEVTDQEEVNGDQPQTKLDF